jgi:phosphate starvation-inducible PhoH-like protein
VAAGGALLEHLYAEINQGITLSPESLHLQLQQAGLEAMADPTGEPGLEALQVITHAPGVDQAARA